MVMVASRYFSAAMVRTLPDDGWRYETVHGELLVSPAPSAWHQEIIARLARIMQRYLEEAGAGHLFVSPADISWGDDILVQPDLFVVPLGEARTMDWARIRSLLLAVEVVSPSSARADRFTKRRLYQTEGVPTYWVIDPEHRCIEMWTPEALFPVIEEEQISWTVPGVDAALAVNLGELFRPL